MLENINWLALPNCPEGQLQKANPTDAGWDIKVAETTWIKPYSHLPFKWETLGIKEELEQEVPELFDPKNYELFMTQDGLRTTAKYLVSYDPLFKREVLAGLNKLGITSITEHREDTFLVGYRDSQAKLLQLEGVRFVDRVVVVQRKQYKPILIPTGIKVQPEELRWMGLMLRSSMTKYAISQAHSIGVIDFSYSRELLIGVYPIQGQTLFRRGERIAQLVPMEQREISFNQLNNEDEFVNHGRGGFGSSNGLKLVA